MDSYEASRSVFSRIQGLEPESASKIMGYLLIQDYGDKEMIRLAFGPESLLQSLVFKAKTHLGLLSKPQSLPSTPSFKPISRPTPLSIPSSNPWTGCSSGFSDAPSRSSQSPSLSYASVLSSTSNRTGSASTGPFSAPFSDPVDEFQLQNLVADDVFDGSPQWEEVSSGFGFGFRPCLYYQRGFCKNGNTCRYVHGDSVAAESNAVVGSPTTAANNNCNLNELEQCQELLMRRKAAQQQHHFMNSSSFPAYDNNNCMSFLMHQHQHQHIDSQRSPTGSMIMGDEMHRFGRCRFDRNEIMNPSSRQIYLTFPADSTFREEDVSNYFSIYGPVQDVRIPYQQKRMFGFVTFMYTETVKLILAKGNPHFVCDSRVLVKPYKEKGKIVEKKQQQQQQFESGDYSSLCSSPSSIDYDIHHHHGPRMFYNAQDMLLMKKLEERATFEQAVERRMMNLQLEDMRNHHYHNHNHNHHRNNAQFHRSLSIPSPNALPYSPGNHNKFLSEDSDQQVSEERTSLILGTNTLSDANSEKSEENDLNVSIEHILPDSLFASPKKSSMAAHTTAFSTASDETTEINNPSLITNIASQESVFSKCSGFLLEPLECN